MLETSWRAENVDSGYDSYRDLMAISTYENNTDLFIIIFFSVNKFYLKIWAKINLLTI